MAISPQTFIAGSTAEAVAQIRAQLGPDAVVLNVRRLPAAGLARLWQKPRIEVLATVPEPPTPASDPFAELREEIAVLRKSVQAREPVEAPAPAVTAPTAPPVRASGGSWCVGAFLENTGLLPIHAQRVVEELRTSHGDVPPDSLAKELDLARGVLMRLWEQKAKASQPMDAEVHVIIGPAGSGKTTALCKWLAQAVLVEGRRAEVWRLDGRTANTAESLSVYAEILGVPVERFVPEQRGPGTELLLIDLPGVDWTSAAEVEDLGRRLRDLPEARVHVALNGAYEAPLLCAQARAFAALPVAGLVVTHLDEEARWGKLWNLVLGTNFSIGFLSAGQNVPGIFTPATAEKILTRQLARK